MHLAKGNKSSVLLLSLLLIFVTLTDTVYAEEVTQEKLLGQIEEIIEWKKYDAGITKEEPLLRSSFVEQAGRSSGDWFPIGIGRIGYPDDYDTYLAVLADKITERYTTEEKLSDSKATEWHRISLAILSLGEDPRKFTKSVDGEWIDLIADGTYAREEDAFLGLQGLNGWTWGLITLDSLQYYIPKDAKVDRAYIIERILERQLDDGGFSLQGDKADPDMTAMTLQALAPYYNDEKIFTYTKVYSGEQVQRKVRDVIEEALACLSELQLSHGGFTSFDIDNTESIVQVIVALTSLGIDPLKDERFIKNGNTLWDALMRFKHEDGGFIHSDTYDDANPTADPDEVNPMATEQALYAFVSMYRFYEKARVLYDFREEMDRTLRKEIDVLQKDIEQIPNHMTKPKIEEIYERYKQLPIEERRYVFNYSILSEAMDQLQIKKDAEYLSEYEGKRKSGKGTVTYYFIGENPYENKDFTKEDVARYEALTEPLTTSDYTEVISLLQKLTRAKNRNQYEEIYLDLKEKEEQIVAIQNKITALNKQIIEDIYPIEKLGITDRKKVRTIIDSYEALHPDDRKKIVNYEDVEQAYVKVQTDIRQLLLTVAVAVILLSLVIVWIVYRRRKRSEKQFQASGG